MLIISGKPLVSKEKTGISLSLESVIAILENERFPIHLHYKNTLHDTNSLSALRENNTGSDKLIDFICRTFLFRFFFNSPEKDAIYWGWDHKIPFFISKKFKSIVTIHDLVFLEYPRTMKGIRYYQEKILLPIALHKADIIITTTNFVKQSIQFHFPKIKDKIRLVPLTSSLDKLKPMAFPSNDKVLQKPFILFVGTIEPRKNLLRLLHAYSNLSDLIKSQFNLVIAGTKGWGKVDLHKEINKLNISQNIIILGYIPSEELRYLYKNAYCLVMPSLYEGFGLPIIEAQEFGTPIITSNTSSMPEIAGKGAVYIDPLSIDSIKSALEKLLGSPTLRNNLSIKAKKNAKRFNVRRTTEAIKSVFNELNSKASA